jgi:hypothetical protein
MADPGFVNADGVDISGPPRNERRSYPLIPTIAAYPG